MSAKVKHIDARYPSFYLAEILRHIESRRTREFSVALGNFRLLLEHVANLGGPNSVCLSCCELLLCCVLEKGNVTSRFCRLARQVEGSRVFSFSIQSGGGCSVGMNASTGRFTT